MNLPDCEQCEIALRQWVNAENIDALDREELDKLKIKVDRYERNAGVRHVIIGIEGIYDLPTEPDQVEQCSYSQHRHWKGVVARTACDHLLQLGMHCGKRCVENFHLVIKAVRDHVLVMNEASADVESFEPRLEDCIRRLESKRLILSVLKRELSEFRDGMTQAYQGNFREVIIPRMRFDRVANREVPDDWIIRMKGLKFFQTIDVAEAKTLLKRLHSHIERRRATHLGRSTVASLKRERDSIKRGVEGIETVLREGDDFWSEDILHGARYHVYRADVPKGVSVDGPTLVVDKERTRWIFSFNSVKKVDRRDS